MQTIIVTGGRRKKRGGLAVQCVQSWGTENRNILAMDGGDSCRAMREYLKSPKWILKTAKVITLLCLLYHREKNNNNKTN